jgi:hypothetical protein
MARGLLAAQTPEPIVAGLARAAAADRSLDITGLHFFTFASLRHTIEWAREAAERAPSAWEARHV